MLANYNLGEDTLHILDASIPTERLLTNKRYHRFEKWQSTGVGCGIAHEKNERSFQPIAFIWRETKNTEKNIPKWSSVVVRDQPCSVNQAWKTGSPEWSAAKDLTVALKATRKFNEWINERKINRVKEVQIRWVVPVVHHLISYNSAPVCKHRLNSDKCLFFSLNSSLSTWIRSRRVCAIYVCKP